MRGINKVTSRQMALFTFIAQTGVGITTLPSILAKDVGHDGWISVSVTGILAIILSMLFVVLLKRYSDKSIYEINRFIFGKVIGTAFNILLVLYLLAAAAAGVRVFSLFLRLTLLPMTPPGMLAAFVLLPSVYLVWQGLKTVIRFKYISVLSYVVAVTYVVLISSELKISYLMPVGEAGLMPILYSIKTSFFAYIGLELVVFFFPEITDKNKTMKWHIFASVFSMLFLSIIVVATTSLFGENLVKIFTIPLFNLARVYNAPILERVDLYIVALWFVAMGCSMRAYMFAAFYSLQKVFNIKRSKPFLIIFFVVLVSLSRIPRDINESFLFLEAINFAGIGVTAFLILCLVLSFIRKKGVNSR
ncbi:MAG: spore germination protein [Clostridia bacterium]|nr:spore germination protein [Clostridia bacterium]